MGVRSWLAGPLRRFLPLAGLLILVCYFSWKAPAFRTVDNLFNIARQQSVIMLIAFGMTLIIISREIDLSVGSVAAFSGITAASFIRSSPQSSPLLCILVGILTGTIVGAVNGFLVGGLRLPSFVATLGTMGMFRGFALMISETAISAPESLRFLSESMPLGIPLPLLLIVVTALLAYFILSHTTFGRAIYAVGGNADAARFAGIERTRVLLMVFTISGALTGLAGMIELSRLSSAQPTTGETYPLDAIAAVVVGGGSLMGGEGSVAGTVIGALVIAVLRNGLDIMSVPPFTQMVYIGALVIAAVGLDQWRRAQEFQR